MVSTRCCLAVFVIVLCVGLVPAAFADPPDPTWIGGYWDDDDFDTVVAFIASALATVVPSAVEAQLFLGWLQNADPASNHFVASPLRNVSRPRAPPIASLPLY